MNLREACQAFNRSPARPLALPPITAVEFLAKRLTTTALPPRERQPVDLDAISSRIHAALADGQSLSIRDLRLAPWCLWASATPLSQKIDQVEKLLRQIVAADRRRAFRVLATVWMTYCRPGGLCVSRIGDFLVTYIQALGSPWREAHQAFGLFSVALGPLGLAQIAMQGGLTPDEVLTALGFRDPSSYTHYRHEAFRLGFEQFARESSFEPIKRLDLLKRWTLDAGRLRIESLRAAAVAAALHPFEYDMPDKDIRDAYLDFILPWMKDPRIGKGSWINCDKAEAIVRRWLMEQSLRQFFEVVDEVAETEHWSYRRAFWNALYAKGYIDDAWVIFESSGAKQARNMFGKDISFGRFSGGSVQLGHSVLLLRVGPLVIAEWSHSSPCSIWDENENERGPGFYDRFYSASDLKKAYQGSVSAENMARQGVFWHRGSDSFSWQKRVADYLHARRGIRMTTSDYKV
ncbi:MAG: hypothetical protein KGQ46_02250 [Hyphomicrobiales bacterium]|nr:hypothetical protein [Hyphomicrobiales bacterium]MDE2114769.1 hypothetical protein [Hyphomicrobiales bacterium]